MRLRDILVCLFSGHWIEPPRRTISQANFKRAGHSAERSFGWPVSAGQVSRPLDGSRVALRCRSDLRFIVSLPMTIEANQRAGEPRVKFIARGKASSTHDTKESKWFSGRAKTGTAARVVKLRFAENWAGRQANLPVRRIHAETTKTASSCFVRSGRARALQTKKEKRRGVGTSSHRRSQEESGAPSNPPETRGG